MPKFWKTSQTCLKGFYALIRWFFKGINLELNSKSVMETEISVPQGKIFFKNYGFCASQHSLETPANNKCSILTFKKESFYFAKNCNRTMAALSIIVRYCEFVTSSLLTWLYSTTLATVLRNLSELGLLPLSVSCWWLIAPGIWENLSDVQPPSCSTCLLFLRVSVT